MKNWILVLIALAIVFIGVATKIIFSFIYCDITIVLELQKVKHDKVIFNWTLYFINCYSS